MRFSRQTLAREARLEGNGLHSGKPVVVRLVPAEQGIQFVLGNTAIQATPENVTDTNRCTKLGEISTVEHLMAAFSGLEVTDADVVLTSPELPALDGSAALFAQEIADAGLASISEQDRPDPFTRIFIHEGDHKLAVSSGDGEWRYEFSCAGKWPELQCFETLNISRDFRNEIAPARTFGFESELDQIKAAGLAKGLDLEKALLIGDSGYANQERFSDEPARHKLLDAMGDLYLSGVPARFLNVVAERTGHRLNVEAAKRLRDAVFGSGGT